MKNHFYICVSVFFLSISWETNCNFIGEEINLSSSPFVACECALSSLDDKCRENYKNWSIFRKNKFEEFTPKVQLGKFDAFLKQYKLINWKKVVVLESDGKIKSASFNSDFGSETIIFCPKSVAENIEELSIKNSKTIYLAPEAISERTIPLKINMWNIANDVYFPTSLYDYQYKIPDYLENLENSSSINETTSGAVFDILLRDVGNVIINSNSISAKYVSLNIDGAKSLTVQTLAVRDEPSESQSSGIFLRKIDTVKLENSWGNTLSIESCKTVHFFPNSVAESIYHFSVFNVTELKHYRNTFKLLRFNSIININLWELEVNSFKAENGLDSPIEKNKTAIRSSYKDDARNVFLLSYTNVVIKLDAPSEVFELTAGKINIENSTFNRQEDDNSTMLFISYEFDLKNQEFPEWVILCQINESIKCDEKENICPVGLPYLSLNESLLWCEPILIIPVIDISTTIFQIFLALGILALVISLVIFGVLIYRYKQISGKWSPANDQSSYSTIEHSTLSHQHQIVCVSARDNPIGTDRFPRSFISRLSPFPYNESGVQFYTYTDDYNILPKRNEHIISRNYEKKLSTITNVQLLKVKQSVNETELQDDDSTDDSISLS